MLDLFKLLIVSQFEAALSTIRLCVETSSPRVWNLPVALYPFSQVIFHALFFADYYLEGDATTFRQQPFHMTNLDLFGDYEQLEDREPVSIYDKQQVRLYLDFCRTKVQETMAAETDESLRETCTLTRHSLARAEMHVYNIRHLQHHAAQLVLRLRQEGHKDLPWVGCGWVDRTDLGR
jgi:hypothetical protein